MFLTCLSMLNMAITAKNKVSVCTVFERSSR